MNPALAFESRLLDRADISLAGLRKRAGSGRLFAILDVCDEPDAFIKVCELGKEQVDCLYSGEAQLKHANIAPYLLAVDVEMFSWIENNLFGKPWGVFLTSSADRETIRRHLKRFLMVEGPDGKPLYFRFYDPRVLPHYLETAIDRELKDFFGPISRFITLNSGDIRWRYKLTASS